MGSIVTSASKIVFILMALGVNGMAFTGKITGEQYMMLAGMAFTFYFANKGETGQVSTQTVTRDDGSSEVKTQTTMPPPFAGK